MPKLEDILAHSVAIYVLSFELSQYNSPEPEWRGPAFEDMTHDESVHRAYLTYALGHVLESLSIIDP